MLRSIRLRSSWLRSSWVKVTLIGCPPLHEGTCSRVGHNLKCKLLRELINNSLKVVHRLYVRGKFVFLKAQACSKSDKVFLSLVSLRLQEVFLALNFLVRQPLKLRGVSQSCKVVVVVLHKSAHRTTVLNSCLAVAC